jgi:hypothetical protein
MEDNQLDISGAFEIDPMFECAPKTPWGLIALVIVAVLLLIYLSTREGVCGGKDQLCPCDGNETMQPGRARAPPRKDADPIPLPGKGQVFPRKSAEDNLSKVAMGY